VLSGIVVAALLLSAAGCGRVRPAEASKRLIVLGIDAMDPAFVERHWDALPNLKRLRDSGEFQRLATTIPPQSPVAWSTFITGMNPGEHGIFDFVHRDPKTMAPFSSLAETEPSRRTIALGPYVIPLSSGRVRRFRRGQAFWELLDAAGVPATLVRMPNNFPPVESKSKTLSGMGAPDLLGTFGTFTYFTDEPGERLRTVPGGRIVPVRSDGGRVLLELEGPENTLRKDRRRARLTITVWRDPQSRAALFETGGTRFLLNEGEWSDWVRVEFPILGLVKRAHAMFRVYAKRLQPDFRVYVSPLNVDPFSPELPISTPRSFSADLARAVGPFYTQGIAEDTAAFREGVFTPEEYRRQSGIVATEQFALLRRVLADSPRGLVFFHFLGIDQDSHMFWGRRETELLETYRRVDAEVGRVLNEHSNATVVVMSDHGFSEFRRAVNLNTWLWREGFLALDDPGNAGAGEGFPHVDWSRTQAYSLGLNAVYVNLRGRERRGSVDPRARDDVVEAIARKLEALKDPLDGTPVAVAVYRSRQVYRGDAVESAPDLIVGWNAGYRSSWQTALGAVPPNLIEDNEDEWRGDHCIAAQLVPGVFFSNRKSRYRDLRLEDITMTVLAEFGVRPPPRMTGRAIF
jgi:predicted AlkP superfamily phosphohydrolase/phosphomutase